MTIAIEFLGWVGSILYAVAGWPQTIHIIKNPKGSVGISWYFLAAMVTGAVIFTIYSWAIGSIPMVVCNISTGTSMIITAAIKAKTPSERIYIYDA